MPTLRKQVRSKERRRESHRESRAERGGEKVIYVSQLAPRRCSRVQIDLRCGDDAAAPQQDRSGKQLFYSNVFNFGQERSGGEERELSFSLIVLSRALFLARSLARLLAL
eukprot:6173866-Pleurochrysis_carterae.AAC.1